LGSSGTYRILVAEDDAGFLETLASLIEADDRFAVAGRARNGLEALEIADRVPVDAVVIDIEMPEVDGIEATRRLSEQLPDVPVVAISGHDYEERVLEIRAAGARDYIRKARVDDDLVGALVALLGD